MENLLMAEYCLEGEGIRIVKRSSVYETEAWGKEDQPDFLNRVLVCQTGLTPDFIMERIKHIEEMIGRKPDGRWGPRLIDIDVLFFDSLIFNFYNCIVPHPMIAERRFTLIPLNEVMAEFIHPVLKKPIAQLLSECSDKRKVWRGNPAPAIYSGQSESTTPNSELPTPN